MVKNRSNQSFHKYKKSQSLMHVTKYHTPSDISILIIILNFSCEFILLFRFSLFIYQTVTLALLHVLSTQIPSASCTSGSIARSKYRQVHFVVGLRFASWSEWDCKVIDCMWSQRLCYTFNWRFKDWVISVAYPGGRKMDKNVNYQ